MNVTSFALLASVALIPAAAAAQSMNIIGSSPAASACFFAADSGQPNGTDLLTCDAALAEPTLKHNDQIATLVNRGIVRFRLNQLDGANSDFDAVLAREPGQPDALINKAIVALAGGGDIEAARAMLDRGLAGSPQRPWVGYYGRAVAHELAGRDSLAYRDYKKAQALKPNWTLAKQALARFSRG